MVLDHASAQRLNDESEAVSQKTVTPGFRRSHSILKLANPLLWRSFSFSTEVPILPCRNSCYLHRLRGHTYPKIWVVTKVEVSLANSRVLEDFEQGADYFFCEKAFDRGTVTVV